MSHVIEIDDLQYRAGRAFELSQLRMRVPHRSVYGFLGPNGAGKTTTIRLLLGLLRAQAGRITVLGEAMPQSHVSVLARTGYVPERPHLYPSLTVGEAIAFHSAFYPSWDAQWAGELRDQFGLRHDQRISAMSKGETGKLLMLLALAQRPQLLVLDEPTDGLDPVVRRDILSALLEYVTEREATVLISSHLVHELERVCDWVGLMDHGRLVAELPMHDFKNGLKRLRVATAPRELTSPPFTVLSREAHHGELEDWLVQGWSADMHQYVTAVGASVREVVDLDLEEGFVELLRSSRERGR
jgi:ABC-2 type transport system ATP-binding protein